MPETGRKAVFLVLQALVAAEGIILVYQGVVEFLTAAGGDATVLFTSAMMFLLAAADFYCAFAIRSRGSSPFYGTIAAAFLAAVVLYAIGALTTTRIIGIVLAVMILVLIIALRNRFQLRPGEIVKEEKLPPDVIASISTKVSGVRCKECGDDDVWMTKDERLVCRNCGSTDA